MDKTQTESIVAGIAENYQVRELCFDCIDRHFPSRGEIIGLIKDMRALMFPRYFSEALVAATKPEYFIGQLVTEIEDSLRRQVREALLFREPIIVADTLNAQVEHIVDTFLTKLPEIQRVLLTDVQAAFDGDPAAQSK